MKKKKICNWNPEDLSSKINDILDKQTTPAEDEGEVAQRLADIHEAAFIVSSVWLACVKGDFSPEAHNEIKQTIDFPEVLRNLTTFENDILWNWRGKNNG